MPNPAHQATGMQRGHYDSLTIRSPESPSPFEIDTHCTVIGQKITMT